MAKAKFKDIYKGLAVKTVCHFESVSPTLERNRIQGIDIGFYRPHACGKPAAGLIENVPLCKEHYEYARFYQGL